MPMCVHISLWLQFILSRNFNGLAVVFIWLHNNKIIHIETTSIVIRSSNGRSSKFLEQTYSPHV